MRAALPKPLGGALKVFVRSQTQQPQSLTNKENYVAGTRKNRPRAPLALTLPEEDAGSQEAFAVNIASGSITEFDLPRIKVDAGTALWLIPSLEGEDRAAASRA